MDSNTELQEKDFINEGYGKDPYPVWIWLVILVAIIALLWGVGSFFRNEILTQTKESPFLQVTNRDLSVFLWQNPSLMRAHVSNKSAYLPGFQFLNKVSIEEGFADQYAVAPPNVLFLYHVWDRLVRNEYSKRPIMAQEFAEFLKYAEEWQPSQWLKAPKAYTQFVEHLNEYGDKDLQSLSDSTLPLIVRQAFQGWKNYFKEGEQINAITPTVEEMRAFLKESPHYARNYWRNILIDSVPSYLKSLDGKGVIPADELAPFLKVAFFNWQKSNL